ncbi:mRNA 3' end processing factor, partial [Dispira simplex]
MTLKSAKMDVVRYEYALSLTDLTSNSRPVISTLTTIAKENLDASPAIVDAIRERLET